MSRPLFPGYVFAKFRYNDRHFVTNTPGIVEILQFGGTPAEMTDEQIRQVKALEEGKARPVEFRPGMAVTMRTGALRGVSGVLVREKDEFRLIVRIEILGRSVEVPIDREGVKAA